MFGLTFRVPWTRSAPAPQPEPVVADDPDVPKIHYASDEDGGRHAVVDAAEMDMSGWTVEAQSDDGRVFVAKFSKRELPKNGDDFSFIFGGKWIPVRVALADWGSDELNLIDPQGERQTMRGYAHS